jgi:hypothetical protein
MGGWSSRPVHRMGRTNLCRSRTGADELPHIVDVNSQLPDRWRVLRLVPLVR